MTSLTMNKPRARKAKNTKSYIKKVNYIKTNSDDIWILLENNVDIVKALPHYRDVVECKLKDNIDKEEEIYYLGVPYDNYAITSFGRTWSFKTKKFIKGFYRPNSVIFYMNSTSNVKMKELFKMAGWKYKHSKVCEKLLSYDLLVNDYRK